MESLDLTFNLVDLKIEGKAPVQIYSLRYFRNIAIVMTKGKIKKIKIRKSYLFSVLPPLSSQDRGGGGGGGVVPTTHPQLFSR